MKRQIYINLTILLLTSLLLASCGGIFYTPPTAAEYCDIDPALLTEGNLKVWAAKKRQYCWQNFAPLLAANQRPELGLEVEVKSFEMNGNHFLEHLTEKAEVGQAPDIALTSQASAIRMSEAGHLYPLDQCRQRPEFAAIPDKFWTGYSPDGRAWGVPVRIEVMLLFYNKTLLYQLGWSQSQIEGLSDQIARGDYTMDDLVTTAREAADSGVVQPGLAFIPTRSQYATIESIYVHVGGRFTDDDQSHLVINRQALETAYSFLAQLHKYQLFDERLAMPSFGEWGNKLLFRDAIVHNRYLFWHGFISEWQSIAVDYLDTFQDTESLREHIGVALLPTSIPGQPGYTHMITFEQYVIFNKQAAENSTNQQAACDLLAATQASGLLQRHTDKSGYPTFTEGGFYWPEWFPAELTMETIQWVRPYIVNQEQSYSDILVEVGVRVERGELTPSEAVDVAVERLRDALGSQLIVE